MAEPSGYEIWLMVSQGASPDELNRAADVSEEARTRIQALADELRRLTAKAQEHWQGEASDRAAQAEQPIEQALQRAQETLGRTDASWRTQAQNYGRLRQQVMPMATAQPPELTLFDELTPWDTDNEIARKEWFEADAHNRRVYGEYAAMTGQNQAVLPQMAQAPGGVLAADTAVQATSGPGVRSAASAPPQVGGAGAGAGATSPSSAGSGGGEKTSAPPVTGAAGTDDNASARPSTSGGGKTSLSNTGGGDGGLGLAGRGPGVQGPAAPGPAAPRPSGDRTTIADWSAAGVPGGLPITAPPPSARDTAHKANGPKGDHLAGAAPVLPGGVGIVDPTGTRGQRGAPGDRSAVVGRAPAAVPVAAGARGAAGRAGTAGAGGFAPHAAHSRGDEDGEHKRTVYLEEDADALIGRLPGSVAPVIGED
ncbi:PPE domain-containing protein [Saccharothrix syringae]|uniref:PPE domain-containing protein n=1 Tax=Saccharothrix syringae TaxID=103733 RepID=A0A5Q0H1S2_SACSY|nr:PPE domain-containing protein [Saccharothrix syringae]QFZ19740.1 PPE domain-containing protein [Saccharothrix syringae]